VPRAWELSAALVAAREAAGLERCQVAGMAGLDEMTVRHAETGLLWQPAGTWLRLDAATRAGGTLRALFASLETPGAGPGAGRYGCRGAGDG
jgi:hypothetical protein